MKKALKIIGIVAVVAIVIIIGLTIFVRSYLTDERIRGFITETAESSLHSKVSIGTISKRGAGYTLNAEADGIRLEEFTAAFAPNAKGILFGNLSARADIGGAGSASETIKRNLEGKGTFSVKTGKIKDTPISEGS